MQTKVGTKINPQTKVCTESLIRESFCESSEVQEFRRLDCLQTKVGTKINPQTLVCLLCKKEE
ncbi:MAG: hypothetical protein DRQ99_31670 [Candidatus Parabeggiatoa sp. nov. 3]|nr:MAG: hypothetical protein DRQ99_31670 [Gammaproteobacteria bacterium]